MKFVKLQRQNNTHKGQNGKVLIVGGSKDYTGCLVLAGLAALRSGCDIITIVAPEKVAWAINAQSPDLITKKMKGEHLGPRHFEEIKLLSERHDVLLFGNGMGLHPETVRLMKKIVTLPVLKVIDADGIKVLNAKDLGVTHNSIITPNVPEWRLFLKNSGIYEYTLQRSNNKKKRDKIDKVHTKEELFVIRNKILRELEGNLILLKGPTDYIITAKNIVEVKGGDPGLTKAGTGDVLAGLVAGYLAQLKNQKQQSRQEQAAYNAAVMHKEIGKLLTKKHQGYTYLASDIVREIQKI